MKKIFSIVLSIAMLFATGVNVFAADTDGKSAEVTIPEYAERHEVRLEVNPGEVMNLNDDSGIMPIIWNQQNMTIGSGVTAGSSPFYLSDRYFAYEAEALPINGVATTQGYKVTLRHSGSFISGMNGEADGSVYKVDWVTIYTDGNYYFEVTNNTSQVITVKLTYYSWN